MRSISAICAAAAAISLAALPARAEISAEAARASVAPFYKALNAEFANDSAELIRQSTTPDWVSCRGNDDCNTRDEVIAGIGAASEIRSGPEMGDQGDRWSPATRSPCAAKPPARRPASSWARPTPASRSS